MPTFIFNKLIRDKLKTEYVKLDHKATYKKLSDSEGLFVEKVELHPDDEWVAYYRRSPEKYEEIS